MTHRVPRPVSVLIVDDDADFVEANRLVLDALGYRVNAAASAVKPKPHSPAAHSTWSFWM